MSSKRQLPGRAEALRMVIKQGVSNSSFEIRHLAGMMAKHESQPRRPDFGSFTMDGSINKLTKAERASLPF